MDVYVITVLEEWIDDNSYVHAYEKCARTLEEAKKLLTSYTHDVIKSYEVDGAECEITDKSATTRTISINDDYGITTLEIQKIKLVD